MSESLYDWCLKNNRQYLIDEWDAEKNDAEGLYINKESASSREKAWWECKEHGHPYKATISYRAGIGRNIGTGCPICTNKMVIEGYNDLASTHPDIAKEWDYDKNEEFTPNSVVAGSNRKVYWKCKNGHSWETTIAHRTKDGTGCPVCNNRQISYPEKLIYLWMSKNFNKVYSRIKVDGFEYDIYVQDIKLAIEYNGYIWHNSEYSKQRNKDKYNKASQEGVHLLTISECKEFKEDTNDFIYYYNRPGYTDIDELLNKIKTYIRKNYQVEIAKLAEEDKILAYKISRGKVDTGMSLAEKYPDLATELHTTLNEGLNANELYCGTDQKVWWKCKRCGGEWKAAVNWRTHSGNGCPVCTNYIVNKGINDIATTRPDMAVALDNNQEEGISKFTITEKNANERVAWVCQNCGFKFRMSPDRVSRVPLCKSCGKPVLLADTEPIYNISDIKNVKYKIDYAIVFGCKLDRTTYRGILKYVIKYIFDNKKETLNLIVDSKLFEGKARVLEQSLNTITYNKDRCYRPEIIHGTNIYVEHVDGARIIRMLTKILNVCSYKMSDIQVKLAKGGEE